MRESTEIAHDPMWTVARSRTGTDPGASMPTEIDGALARDLAVARRLAGRLARVLPREPAIASREAGYPSVHVHVGRAAGSSKAHDTHVL